MSWGQDSAELKAAFAAYDRLGARLAVAVAEFEAPGRHELDGALTMPSWLRQHAGRDARTAVKITATGRKLRALPVLRDAVLDGAISGGQLEVVVANVPMRHVTLFAEHEAAIVPALVGLDVDSTRRAMEAWRARADAVADDAAAAEHPNELYLSTSLDARGELRGSFDADVTAVVDAALRVADPKDFSLPMPERRAHALAQVCQHFLDHQRERRGGRHRPHLNVVVTDGSATYVDTGQSVSPAALGVLRCDSAYHRVLTDGASAILDYGRATRAWPVDLYNAIVLRDGGCRIGACDAPPSWCDVHHVVPWEDGGETSIDNGALACRRHHRAVHHGGFRFKLLPGGTAELTRPDGTVEVSEPRGPSPPWLLRSAAGV
jgi:hypothetical protein